MGTPNTLRVWILFACAAGCSGEVMIDEPEEIPIDPGCAGEDAPSESPRIEGLPWDLGRELDSDRPVCDAEHPDCDRLDEPDAIDDELIEISELALAHDSSAVAYGLTDPLTSTAKYRTWPNGRIPYRLATTNGVYQINAATRTALSQAMTNWEQKTEGRIKFRPKASTDIAYVIIKEGSPRVRPFVGYRKDQVQELYLRDSEYITVIKHELGHVVGLHHEQRRSDRLSYIQVRTANIVATDACRYQFSVCSTCKRVGTYDRTSVMHYRTTDLGNCRTGSVLLKLDGSAISHYWQLSTKDLTTVATMYDAAPPPQPPATTLPETGSVVTGALCASVVDSSMIEGAEIQMQACAGAGNQDWRITVDGQLRVQHSLQCADVAGCSAAGAVVEQATCSPTTLAQKWTFGELEIVNGVTGKCLDAPTYADGEVLRFAACSAADGQQFAYRPETETFEAGGWCVTATDRALAGDDVVLAACDGRVSQQWFQGRGGFVTRANTARCMRVEAGPQTGTKIELGDCSDAIDQRWALRGNIRDARSELCLAGGEAGTRLALAACDGSPAQTWTFWSR